MPHPAPCPDPPYRAGGNVAGCAAVISRTGDQREVRASYAVTPFLSQGRATSTVSFSDPYYDSDRYIRFIRSVNFHASDMNVRVESTRRALGIWNGTSELSAAIGVIGRREDIESVARIIGSEFDQYAVRIIYSPGGAMHKLYSFEIGSHDPKVTMATLHDAGITGARIIGSRIEIADAEDLNPETLRVLEEIYGSATITPCEVARVLLGS